MAERRLRSVKEAILVGTSLRYFWFRGHDRTCDLILPAVFRPPFWPKDLEYKAAQRFRLRAGTLTASALPAYEDHISWLIFMQHFGVPTRLTDWSASCLVGLYFATGGDPSVDGELWCIDPMALNRRSRWELCMPDSAPIRYCAGEVFTEAKLLPTLAGRVGLAGAPPELPLALVPSFGFPRMAAQFSRFTIHPSARSDRSIERLLGSEYELIRYRVAAEDKPAIRWDLRAVGITHETLFGSLESLAASIRDEILEPDYVPVPPPEF